MSPSQLQYGTFYLIDGKKYRYMGRTYGNRYTFYDDRLEVVLLGEVSIHQAEIRNYEQTLLTFVNGKED